MKKIFTLLMLVFVAQMTFADDVIASYTFPDEIMATQTPEELAARTAKTASASDVAGTNCTVSYAKMGGYTSSGGENWKILNGTYFQKLTHAEQTYINIKLNSGSFQAGDVFKATMYNGGTDADGLRFKLNTADPKTIAHSKTEAVTLEYTLTANDINDDGSVTVYRANSKCFVNTISVERSSGAPEPIESVKFLNTNFTDGTWGDITHDSNSIKEIYGSFGTTTINGYYLDNALMMIGSGKLVGPSTFSDEDIIFTNRIGVDKNSYGSHVITPYVTDCQTLYLVANHGSDDKDFAVSKQVGRGTWTDVNATNASSKTVTLYKFDINSDEPVRFKITNNQGSTLYLWYIATVAQDGTKGDLPTSVTNITADDLKADGKIYNLSGMEVKTPAKGVYIQNGKKFVVK